MMKAVPTLAALLAMLPAAASAQVNLGAKPSDKTLPFTMSRVADFKYPWRIAFLPDGRMLITEKGGALWLVNQSGTRVPVAGVPAVLAQGQGGLLGVYLSPHYATDHHVYLTYSEPQAVGGSSLALARANLSLAPGAERLADLKVIWHDGAGGKGGQFGAQIAFSPDGKLMYLCVGDRQRMTPAQDPNSPLGKILRLTLDGKPAPGNPQAGKAGAASLPITDPPSDTQAAKTAPVIRSYTFPGPNLTPSETWTSGHRTPYGLAFAPDGRLWEVEHGPMGGDELNLLQPGRNYGWPLVSYAVNYNGVPIPSPDTRPDLARPVLYWTPVIAPGNMIFYHGKMFPQWEGSMLIGGLASMTLNRVVIEGGNAKGAERWALGVRARDVEVGPDGALWLLEDSAKGGLYRITPK